MTVPTCSDVPHKKLEVPSETVVTPLQHLAHCSEACGGTLERQKDVESADKTSTTLTTAAAFRLLVLTPVGVTRLRMIKGEPKQLMQHVQLMEMCGTNTLCCQAEHLLPLTL